MAATGSGRHRTKAGCGRHVARTGSWHHVTTIGSGQHAATWSGGRAETPTAITAVQTIVMPDAKETGGRPHY